jgi:hypothetical protein
MPDTEKFVKSLKKRGVGGEIIEQILSVPYPKDDDPPQDNANFYAAAMRRCVELLGFEKTAEVMYERACCKSGYRLANAKQLFKEHGDKPVQERLALLGTLQYMGKPRLNADGDIETVAVGREGAFGMRCPCWHFKGRLPEGGMPLSYCLCCAGHFRFHYESALGVRLRAKRVVSSMLNSGGEKPCAFVFEIIR